MSCYKIEYQNGAKVMRPVSSIEEYMSLRGSDRQKSLVAKVRSGDIKAKGRLLQFNYSCIPGDDGLLKGCRTPSTTFAMDIDHVPCQEMEMLGARIVALKDKLGLLMLERSARGEGFHLVMRRRAEMGQEENLHSASALIGVAFDEGAKDITRVFFATTADPADLLYINDELFRTEVAPCHKPETTDSPPHADRHDILPPERRNGMEYPSSYDSDGETVSYESIVTELEALLGGVPAHGARNNFIFAMSAYMRYICNDDAEWIASILPTYGEAREKWRRTIDSACQRAQYKAMPKIVKQAIDNARNKALTADEDGKEHEDLPPEMPAKLPALISHLIKNVPEVCRPAVANAVFPSLATHLHGVKFHLIDGMEKEPTFMCVIMARQSSGKASVNKPIEYIIADIVERDELSRRREQEWKETVATKGDNKEKPKRPSGLCVQVLVSDMTNAAFVQRMKEANGRYLYTNMEELSLLKQLQTNGTKDIGKIICLCFDNGKYGQERVGITSVTAHVALRWNWNASSTIRKGIDFFHGRLIDGTLSRLNFCTIIQDKSKPFKYGQYDEKYAEDMKPFIDNLNRTSGHIECRQALDLAAKMLDNCLDRAALTDDDVYQDLVYRAVTIAYMKAMVLYIADGRAWSDEIADFAVWSLDYDLWCKCHFFGDKIAEEKAKEKVKRRRGRQNLLEHLPSAFVIDDAIALRKSLGMPPGGCRHMLQTWVSRGYIEYDTSTGIYVKTE